MSKSQEGLYELIPLDSKKEEIKFGDNKSKIRHHVRAKRWNFGETVILAVSEALSRLDVEMLRQQLWAQDKSQGKDIPLLIVSPVEFKFFKVVKLDEKNKPEDNKIKENSV